MRDRLIGLVGKPSAGKSTMLNALTDADAKMGSFPFTTIDPNRATGYLQIPCACSRYNVEDRCKPNYGWCSGGTRHVPVALLDVAGLVPGAHEGKGLGNKFLDDLRHADALIHVVDVSGTTNAEGKQTRGYDPLADVEWLQDEIFRWIRGNLTTKWGSIARRHTAVKAATADTLANQFSGYGASRETVQRALIHASNELGTELPPLEHWTPELIDVVVRAFTAVKFPTVLALNKCDHPDSDRNIERIAVRYAENPHVLTSAMSEVLLRKLAKQGFIKYEPGSEFVDTADDMPDAGLKPMDDKLSQRVETVRDLVLYRFGSTGVAEALRKAVEILDLIPVYPVRSISHFGSGKSAFPDCVLVRRHTPVESVVRRVMGDVPVSWVEGLHGKVGFDEPVDDGKNDVLMFKLGG